MSMVDELQSQKYNVQEMLFARRSDSIVTNWTNISWTTH